MKACWGLASVLLLTSFLSAQTFRGGIQGTVTDTSGAAVPQAQIKITNTGTGLERNVQTDESGSYTATELPLGEYSVTTSKTGFSTRVLKGVRGEVSSNARVDVRLSPGEVKETVEVSADVPIIETTSNTLGGMI